ncbi:lysophospholipid acyltransferase family protein [Miniphocaeibacter halophilus]|uniref:1-acyl-sn-glycerol-3-phosphate acyltransferase n=1 Tax=Miniphocaeibacter halophilus TaxID=2931922 RepID=A0AC61MTD3_9FIRM|nr:lysophospholipid acyltransferase family protein [Miniphocaeibacter halophilus]QQK07563.1 1-acyl-sn-glycerol-3-phosphate acyltransferase [Miniphocaeibacter halophilus]
MYWFFRNILWVVLRIIFRIEVKGKENINTREKLIICSNHISILDPLILAITYNRQIHFMAKKELFEIPIIGKLFYKVGAFPVDRKKADLKSIKQSLKILKEDKVLGIFPEGTRVNTIDKNNVKDGIGMMANRANSDILPVHIETEYKIFRKVKVTYKPIVKIDKFLEVPKELKNRTITLAAYNEIYDLSE